MSGLIHLVRHGEVHNPDNICYADIETFGLSSRGRRQAEAAGQWLQTAFATEVVAAFVSPLRRARETFDALGLGLAPTHDGDLTEWKLALRWKGERWDELDEIYPGEVDAYWNHPLDLPFSPESLEQLSRRMEVVARRAHRENPDGALVIVSHQDPVQAARLILTGQPLDRLHHDKPAHGSVITLEPAEDQWAELSHWMPDQG